MSPSTRTPQQRDRRFARVRNLTMSIFVSSGVISAVFIGYAASIAKPVTTTPTPSSNVSTPSATTTPSTVSHSSSSTNVTPTTVYTPPVSAPVTTTTVCTTTPSGTTTCY